MGDRIAITRAASQRLERNKAFGPGAMKLRPDRYPRDTKESTRLLHGERGEPYGTSENDASRLLRNSSRPSHTRIPYGGLKPARGTLGYNSTGQYRRTRV